MITVSDSIQIDESNIQFDYVRASGPGGQNVNKVATSVQLRYDIMKSSTLEQRIKDRLIKLCGTRVTADGVLIIEAKRYRTQEQNRMDAINRLVTLVQKAAEEPKIRKKTRPSLTASAARVDEKKRRGTVKRIRRYDPQDWDA
jgi:ribosome-associated protein